MIIISLNTDKLQEDGAITLELSDGSSLLLSLYYLPDSLMQTFTGTETGGEEPTIGESEISPDDEAAFRFAALCYRAEKTALRLVARAEQNSLGLAAKLERRGYTSGVAKAVVARLLNRNLLDDSRYAELWVRSRLTLKKAPSPNWLLASLVKRGIDKDTARKTLAKVLDPEAEYALLLRYLEKTRIPDAEKVRYLRAQLKYEGFSFDALELYFKN
ncbi:MAG: recombination regulator RecX [Treponema sp.]|nr:recombination regulator RecX [Treponema sp.]